MTTGTLAEKKQHKVTRVNPLQTKHIGLVMLWILGCTKKPHISATIQTKRMV